MALGYQNPFYLKQAQQKQQSLYNGKVLLEKHDPPAVFVSQKAKSREESYFSNTSKTANVSKTISIPNEEFSDDTSPSVARKFLNEVKSTIVTLQRVVKQKMTLDIHNWSSSAHQELLKIVKEEIYPIVNQVDAMVQNFEIQFLKEAVKFVRDFKSPANEADESLAKQQALEFEIERLLKAVVSKDIMSIVQNPTVVESSDLQTELERTKERTPLNIYENAKLTEPRINPLKTSREDKFVPINKARASVRTKPITVSQPHVITKKDVNSVSSGFSPKDIECTTRTRRPQPRNNPKNAWVLSKSKSSCLSNNLEKIEENHKNLQSSFTQEHTSPKCNDIKLAIRSEKSEVIRATCKQCLITANHDECVLQYVNDMKSRKKNQRANVSKSANQKKHKANVNKSKKVGSKERLASPKPSKPRYCLRWSPTGRIFDLKGKIIESSESDCQSDISEGDIACTSSPQEPIRKRFPNSTFSMTGCQNWFDTLLILLLSEYKPKDKEGHGDDECNF
ncbi:hypothetical protein Tco_0969189 [Tanacetum coccineum]